MSKTKRGNYHFLKPSSPQQGIYTLTVRQQPVQAKVASVGDRSGDRKVIDPAVIVELQIEDAEQSENVDSSHFLYNPFLFGYATLLDAATMQEVQFLSDKTTRILSGSVASCIYHLKDPEKASAFGAFFVFPDISVRKEGTYCLKITLFKIYGGAEEYQSAHSKVVQKKSIITDKFVIYGSRAPGPPPATSALSRSFVEQGLKLRVRKVGRTDSNRDDSDVSDSDSMHESVEYQPRSAKPPAEQLSLPSNSDRETPAAPDHPSEREFSSAKHGPYPPIRSPYPYPPPMNRYPGPPPPGPGGPWPPYYPPPYYMPPPPMQHPEGSRPPSSSSSNGPPPPSTYPPERPPFDYPYPPYPPYPSYPGGPLRPPYMKGGLPGPMSAYPPIHGPPREKDVYVKDSMEKPKEAYESTDDEARWDPSGERSAKRAKFEPGQPSDPVKAEYRPGEYMPPPPMYYLPHPYHPNYYPPAPSRPPLYPPPPPGGSPSVYYPPPPPSGYFPDARPPYGYPYPPRLRPPTPSDKEKPNTWPPNSSED